MPSLAFLKLTVEQKERRRKERAAWRRREKTNISILGQLITTIQNLIMFHLLVSYSGWGERADSVTTGRMLSVTNGMVTSVSTAFGSRAQRARTWT